MINAKRAKVINGTDPRFTSTAKKLLESGETVEAVLSKYINGLYDHLETSNKSLDKEVKKLFNGIWTLTSQEEVVHKEVLDLMITKKFLALVLDFLKLGNDESIDSDMYGEILKDVLGVCINLTTTSDTQHEQLIAESGILKELLQCFLTLDLMDLSEEILWILVNFMSGKEVAKEYAREIRAIDIFRERAERMIEKGLMPSVTWLQKFTLASLAYITGSPCAPIEDALLIVPIVISAIESANEDWDDSILVQIFKNLDDYLKEQPPVSLSRLSFKGLDQSLLMVLPKLSEPSDRYIIKCLLNFINIIDPEPFITVDLNLAEFRRSFL